mgnify:CR=1 FL=1
MDYFHVLPLGAGRTLIRCRSFGFKDDRREMKAARFFCARLNGRVQMEDEVLTESVQRGLESGAYTQGILSVEVVLAGFQDWIRERSQWRGRSGCRRGDDGGEESRRWRADRFTSTPASGRLARHATSDPMGRQGAAQIPGDVAAAMFSRRLA